ncbi:MAG: hypothetical protein HY686_09075 [Chloroflexi bacterium]|nr:hypothetical protein [Chloroflexota bacterium]
MEQQATPRPLVRRSKLVVSPLSQGSWTAAATSGADALVVDVASSVPPGAEGKALALAREVLPLLARSGSDLLLWVAPSRAEATLELCRFPSLAGVVVAAETPEEIRGLDAALTAWERTAGLPPGKLQIDLVLASARAALGMDTLVAASRRVVSLNLDEDGLLAELGVERSLEVDQIFYPRGRSIIVARLFNIQAHALAFVRGTADALETATVARKMGLRGALCFDAADVPALNQGFSPPVAEVEHARQVKAAMEEGIRQGLGAVSLPGGVMIDLAMLKHAQAVLRWAEAIEARESAKAGRG